jgi:hypothetical protein
MDNMQTLNLRRRQDGNAYAYLVKRSARPRSDKALISWYLGPLNEETLAQMVEVVSELMIGVHQRENVGNKIRCPVCGTPVSKLGIEEVVASRLFERLKKMEERNEDVYHSEEYETLKLIAETLTK